MGTSLHYKTGQVGTRLHYYLYNQVCWYKVTLLRIKPGMWVKSYTILIKVGMRVQGYTITYKSGHEGTRLHYYL